MSRRKRARARPAVLPDAAVAAGRIPRHVRVAGELQQELALALRELEDPRLAAVGITRVELTPDLRYARVYVRVAFGADDEAVRQKLMHGLSAARGRLRRHVGAALALRYTPQLRFIYDEGPDAAVRVEELLAEIRQEQNG